jgi:hypothetical protein
MSAEVFANRTAPKAQKRPPKRKLKLETKWNVVFLDEVVTSDAFRELSPVARSLLLGLFNMVRSFGTDRPIGCSSREAKKMLNMKSKTTGTDALSVLEASGFIVSIKPGRQHEKERVASSWRLTFLPFKGIPPTREYVRRHYKAKDMEAFEPTNEKFFDEKLEAMWLENQAIFADNPADFDESQWA